MIRPYIFALSPLLFSLLCVFYWSTSTSLVIVEYFPCIALFSRVSFSRCWHFCFAHCFIRLAKMVVASFSVGRISRALSLFLNFAVSLLMEYSFLLSCCFAIFTSWSFMCVKYASSPMVWVLKLSSRWVRPRPPKTFGRYNLSTSTFGYYYYYYVIFHSLCPVVFNYPSKTGYN